jgi:hypothetical protein
MLIYIINDQNMRNAWVLLISTSYHEYKQSKYYSKQKKLNHIQSNDYKIFFSHVFETILRNE